MFDSIVITKLLSVFVHIIPGVPILLLLLLLSRRWWPRLSSLLSILLVVFLISMSSPPVSNFFVSKLENTFPPLTSAPADTGLILVLGYRHQEGTGKPANSILTTSALSRITEGVRLWKTQPEAMLAVSGADLNGTMSHARALKQMALALGVPEEKITGFDTTRHTREEIDTAISFLDENNADGRGRLIIVSSATHLPRAEMMIKHRSIDYSMAPTDYLVEDALWHRADTGFLNNFDRALQEWIGMLWHRLSRSLA